MSVTTYDNILFLIPQLCNNPVTTSSCNSLGHLLHCYWDLFSHVPKQALSVTSSNDQISLSLNSIESCPSSNILIFLIVLYGSSSLTLTYTFSLPHSLRPLTLLLGRLSLQILTAQFPQCCHHHAGLSEPYDMRVGNVIHSLPPWDLMQHPEGLQLLGIPSDRPEGGVVCG